MSVSFLFFLLPWRIGEWHEPRASDEIQIHFFKVRGFEFLFAAFPHLSLSAMIKTLGV